MSSVAQKSSAAALFTMGSLEAVAIARAPLLELRRKIEEEVRTALPTDDSQKVVHSPLLAFVNMVVADGKELPATVDSVRRQVLSDVDLYLSNKRKQRMLLKLYNPLHGMSEQERIRATARTVGLDIPQKKTDLS
ncbi:hypothetical protein MVES1_002972 [Malassezia vespertilionis]|uniref:uncharacterized protein n=1 Tax=Malassezia vespertilionis TaxID=2020962 RepID=UPI0024B1A999|nr:uncharacterized protein MVES1_002972 [Malassezia vespertilionis]WFD07605.1 hypothetical protein MVES1_002972 [Malassezia vespertilionis]